MAGVLRQMKPQVTACVYARLRLQGLKSDERQQFDNLFHNWLSVQRRCFVVQFVVPEKVELVVDGRRRLVWDSKEEYPIELNADSLRFCSEAESRNVRVCAMEMIQQHKKKTLERKPVEKIELDWRQPVEPRFVRLLCKSWVSW